MCNQDTRERESNLFFQSSIEEGKNEHLPVTFPAAEVKQWVTTNWGSRYVREPYKSPDFEYVSPVGESERTSLIRWMLSLPEKEAKELFQRSRNLAYISANAASHKALERMYTGPVRSDERSDEDFVWGRLFIDNIHNSMAVRNRLRIIKGEFAAFMHEKLDNEFGRINVLSVAAGSSRGIMEVLADINGRGEDRIRLRMVDINREALRDGVELVNSLGIDESVEFIRSHFLLFHRYLEEGYRPDFVEIAGLLDYVQENDAIKLLSALRVSLTEGGAVIYSNIAPNDEQSFTHGIVGWLPMIYRDQYALRQLALTAGFEESKLRSTKEPLGVYNLVIAKK